MFSSNFQRAFTLALLGFPTVALAEVEYEFFLVESFQPEYQYSEVNIFDINENNVALGGATGGAFLWTEATGKILLPLSSPRGINNHGMIAAGVEVIDTNTWEHIDVPAPSASYYLRTLASINDSGLGVGGSSHGGPSCEPFDCPYGCGAVSLLAHRNSDTSSSTGSSTCCQRRFSVMLSAWLRNVSFADSISGPKAFSRLARSSPVVDASVW